MSEIIGRQIEVGVSVEQTRGTAQANPEKWIKNVTCNIIEKASHAINDSSHGSLEDSDDRRVVKKWIEGDMDGIVGVDTIGYLIYSLYSSVASTWKAAGCYEHVFNMLQSIQHKTLAIFAKDGSVQQKVFNGCMLSKFELTAAIDNYLRFKASFMGRTAASNSSSPSYSAETDFIGKDISVKLADTEAGLAGATASEIKDLNITWDQGLIDDYILGSNNPDDIYNGMMKIEGSFTKNFIDSTFKDLYLGDAAKYAQITIQGSTAITGAHYPTITILLNKIKIMEWDRSGDRDKLVEEKVKFTAFYNATDAKQSQVTIKNTASEYSSAPSA